ncbi:hypothetical protein SAY86_021371 [Trapa natans]|uniref:phosphoglycerate mutase (2,3-diphosphoglycerate-dependent) n=1 Tax=Trapa natans TaxID=22666 RepID=A0AAN7RD10_TRANT|nr:hypothetical protein SAY86_021371 [Trapa natans]
MLGVGLFYFSCFSSSWKVIKYEAALILIRHGESLWNEKDLFTGCVDVPLTKKGIEEAIEAGKRISNIPVDVIYTSALIRAQMTALKVPIILHDENERAHQWSQIFSRDTEKQSIPVITAWQSFEQIAMGKGVKEENLAQYRQKITGEITA